MDFPVIYGVAELKTCIAVTICYVHSSLLDFWGSLSQVLGLIFMCNFVCFLIFSQWVGQALDVLPITL